MSNDTITIYWAPAQFTTFDQSWDYLYTQPESVFTQMVRNSPSNGTMTTCPAVKSSFKNTFVFRSNIDDEFDIPEGLTERVSTQDDKINISEASKLSLYNVRKTSYEGYANLCYNMSWALFAEESVEAKFTAPYYPASSPMEGALMSGGQFDIGKWFRPFNLDWHVPFKTKSFSLKEGQPIFFLEILTDKKVEFKRYAMSPRLFSLAKEMSNSSRNYGKFKTLAQRYEGAKRAQISEIVLAEIKRNLID